LFDQDQFSADQFNQLVEGGMRIITDLLEANMSKEQLEEYLQVKVAGRDETRKVILQFWKQEGAQLLQAVRTPTLNVAQQGLNEIDWEIQSTMATRHQQTVGKQSATIVIQPKRGDKIIFEANK
jgi:hypothetical protein